MIYGRVRYGAMENDPKETLGPFPSFFKNYRKSLKNWNVLRDFRIFRVCFRYIYFWFFVFVFLDRFPHFFGSVSGFQKKDLISQFVDRFHLLMGPFPHFLGRFPVFRKSFKLSYWWLVSSFFGSVSGSEKMRKQTQKRGNRSTNWEFKTFY